MSDDKVQRVRRGPAPRVLGSAAAALLAAAAAWDGVGALAAVPPWWPVPGYVGIGAGVALGCVGIMVHVLTTRREHRARRITALRLVALGVLLGAWLLRGHHEIPADPPVIVAQLAAATVLLISGLLHR
jgi:hypothetical protein